jgi:hypothetical protein
MERTGATVAEHLAESVVPLAMRRLIAETEAREIAEAQAREAERADEAEARARMADHAIRSHIALTGHSPAEWRQAQQAKIDYLSSVGYDPAAPVGSSAHPAIISPDGEDLSSPRTDVAGAARRYESSAIEAQLQRHRDGEAQWNSAPIRRQRMICLQAQIARHGPPPPGHGRRPAATQETALREWERNEISRRERLGVPADLPLMIRWLQPGEADALAAREGDY